MTNIAESFAEARTCPSCTVSEPGTSKAMASVMTELKLCLQHDRRAAKLGFSDLLEPGPSAAFGTAQWARLVEQHSAAGLLAMISS